MRFGRIILAGLAPVLGLSALAAVFLTSLEIRPASHSPRLLHPVVSFLLSADDAAAATPAHAPALAALSSAPLRSSLYLLASVVAVNFLHRRHQRSLLRC